MAVEQEGIMSLPQGASNPAMQISLDDSYDAAFGGLEDASPTVAADTRQVVQGIVPMLDEFTDEQLDAIIQLFQYMLEKPEEYSQVLQEAIKEGVFEPDTLPEEHDPELLSAILAVLVDARRQRQMGNQRAAGMGEASMPPMQFARGGIAEAARMVASKGRNGDTMLAHITPSEARLLKARGGSGTINPETGLPEFFFKKIVKAVGNVVSGVGKAISGVVSGVAKVVKSVVSAVQKVVRSPIGRVLATVALAAFIGPTAFGASLGTAGTAAFSSGVVTAVGGGNVKDILRSAATAYLAAPGGPVSNYVGKTFGAGAMGITNAAAASAINAGIVGTGVGLLSGQKLADAVKSGLVSGALAGGMTGAQLGFKAQVPGTPGAGGPELPLGRGGVEATGPGTAPSAPGQGPGTTAAGPLTSIPQGADAGLAAPGKPYLTVYGDSGAHSGTNVIPDYSAPGAAMAGATQAAGAAGATQAAGAVQAAGAPGAPRPVPGVMDSLGRIGGGIADIFQGNVKQGFSTLAGGAGDLFMPGSATPAQLRESPEYSAAIAKGATDAAALAEAGKTYNPSIIRSYGPGLAAGLGTMAMTGGFTPKQVQPSALAEQLSSRDSYPGIEQDPSKYYVQGLPGVKYDERGAIIGSTPYSPQSTMADVRVATPGIMPPAPTYTPPQYALGSPQAVTQPYNTASMYSNLLPPPSSPVYNYQPYRRPTYLNDGGIASLAGGGYPRRTGQISGPGTEKSDSIPAMLSDGEFVMTAKAVRGAGKGDRRAGAKKMYALMHQLERNASRG